MNDSKAFWSTQSSSLNRSSDPAFYYKKACEHAALMTREERAAGCVDLGCGAGEMLRFFADEVRVIAGLDFSETMLEAARIKLSGRDVELLSTDVFEYLPGASIPVWTTTGGLNQYMSQNEVLKLLEIFSKNKEARSFFLFDCIDPIRYATLPLGISYRDFGSSNKFSGIRQKLSHMRYRIRHGLRIMLGTFDKDVQPLKSAAMGYAIMPRFWLRTARELGLPIEMVSSRYYEYRYHVIIRKEVV